MGFSLHCIFKKKNRKKKFLIAGLEIMRGTWFHDLSWQPVDCEHADRSGITFKGTWQRDSFFDFFYIKRFDKLHRGGKAKGEGGMVTILAT
jgi:hypothetical protein